MTQAYPQDEGFGLTSQMERSVQTQLELAKALQLANFKSFENAEGLRQDDLRIDRTAKVATDS